VGSNPTPSAISTRKRLFTLRREEIGLARISWLQVNDGAAWSTAANVTLNVAPVNDAPVLALPGQNFLTFHGGNEAAIGSVVTTQINDVTMVGWANWSGASNPGAAQNLFYSGNTSTSGFGVYGFVFLLPLREKAAAFAGLAASELQHVLITEYGPGAAIGWHKDKAVFGEVVGISLLSSCTFRLRRKAGAGWERASLVAEPGSAYLLRGASRTEWEHSIPAVESLRYSITFRNLRSG
jgi:hypothetical protein